jgi:hypothetical protein
MTITTNEATTDLQKLADLATLDVERLEKELDITNADHIALWLASAGQMSISYLAVQIANAYDRAIAKNNETTHHGTEQLPTQFTPHQPSFQPNNWPLTQSCAISTTHTCRQFCKPPASLSVTWRGTLWRPCLAMLSARLPCANCLKPKMQV